MREQFLVDGSSVRAFVISFDAEHLKWHTFREDIVGATDPARASEKSLRGTILADWKTLGLPNKPSMAENGVHASAGALEGLKERLVWISQKTPPYSAETLSGDPFGAALLKNGVSAQTLACWLETNPVVSAATVDGSLKGGKFFDLTEGMDSSEVLELARSLAER
jgi:hypothetical protein